MLQVGGGQGEEQKRNIWQDAKYNRLIEWSKYISSESDCSKMSMIVMQLICDTCGKVLLEKRGLSEEKFPITSEEAQQLDKEHRGHECHIEPVEKEH
jgi:hypothetical protein